MSLHWVLVGGAGVAASLAALEWWLGRRDRRRESAAAWEEFDRRVADQGLTPTEVERLRRWADRSAVKRPQEALQFVEVFERFIADEVALLGSLPPPDAPDEGRERSLAELRSIRRKLELHSVQKGAPLRSSRELEVGLSVTVRGGVGGDERGDFRVASIDDEKLLLEPRGEAGASGADSGDAGPAAMPARTPISGEYSVHDLTHDEIWVIFWRGLDAIYRFRAPVLRRDEDGAIVAGHGSKLIRVQNRRDKRIDARFGVAIARAGHDEIRGTTINISIGGASILSPVELDKGAMVDLTVDGDAAPIRTARAEVVRKGKIVDADGDQRHYLHCRFLDLDVDVRAALASWVERRDLRASQTLLASG